MMSELKALNCKGCGAPLPAATGSYSVLSGDAGFFYHGNTQLKCQYCSTVHEPNTQVPLFTGNIGMVNGDGALAQGNGAKAVGAGGIMIGGDASQEDLDKLFRRR